jgi:cytochrome c oxidase subunit 2
VRLRAARTPAGLLVTALLLGSGCSGEGVQSALDPAGDQARAIALVWNVMLSVCTGVYLLVMASLGWALWRGRRRSGQPLAGASAASGDPPPPGLLEESADPARASRFSAGERGWSLGLVAWVAFTATVLMALTALSYAVDRRLLEQRVPDQVVRLTGKQWWWQVEYLHAEPAQIVTTANELHLPLDRTTRIELHSGDVIHSLWIPNLHGKRDLIPGRVGVLQLTPRREGRFRGECAEFCGLQHAHMALDVVVEDAAHFEAWRQAQLAPPRMPQSAAAARGRTLFLAQDCVMCHAIRGTPAGGRTGPDLTHFASRLTLGAGTLPLTRGNLAAWLSDPHMAKPGVHMPVVPLSAAQRDDLVAFLMELQ